MTSPPFTNLQSSDEIVALHTEGQTDGQRGRVSFTSVVSFISIKKLLMAIDREKNVLLAVLGNFI